MLLTSAEQAELRTYCIYNMIKNQQAIRNLFGDPDLELPFIDAMIEQNYKRAFDLCCAVFNVYDKEQFIQNVLDYIYPDIRKKQARYNMFVKDLQANDFEEDDKLTMYIHDQLETLANIIFN